MGKTLHNFPGKNYNVYIMSVEFNEPEFGASTRAPKKTERGVIGLIIKTGLAKNATQANLVMIGLIVVLILISWFSLSSMSSPSEAVDTEPPVDEVGTDPTLP